MNGQVGRLRRSRTVLVKELYRVLRPCGGMMFFEGMTREAAAAVVSSAGIPQSEIASEGGALVVRRGKLAGAFDWDSEAASDTLVKWPLELLWFGGPGPSRMTARHRARWGGAPVTANGRYFAPGYHDVIAVDAYNGCELWSRRFDHAYWGRVLRSANDRSVYVARDASAAEFDAQTGRLVKAYGTPNPTPSFSLRPGESREFETPVTSLEDGEYSGRIVVKNAGDAIELMLVALTPHSDAGARRLLARDIWELRFDFRRASERLYPEGKGAFRAVVFPAEMTLSPPRGGPPGLAPGVDLLRLTKLDVEGGFGVRATLPWSDVRELVRGDVAGDFTLGAKVTLWRGVTGCVNDEAARSHPLTGGRGFFRDGVARFVTDPARVEDTRLPVGDMKDLPTHALRPARQPPTAHGLRRRPSMLPAKLPAKVQLLDRDVRRGLAVRKQPVTGNLSERLYVRSYGCGGVMSSAAMDFMRSGVFSMYDLEDDSGLRDFAGVRMGCASSAVASQGVLIYSEGTSDCGCAYAFYSSFALAPAERRKNEDWAMFMDEHMNYASGIREMALNLGAPGDRRDPDGVLWLHFPRRLAALADGRKVMTIDLPCRLEFCGEFEPARLNADRTPVKGAGHPWIVSSALVGLRKATVELGGGAEPSEYTIRLHFAELREDVREGERVFDVRLQGRTVLEGLDVVAAAGGARTGLVYEYEHVPATDTIVLELVPRAGAVDARTVPVVSGMAIFNEAPETFGPPVVENGEAKSPGYDSVRIHGKLGHDGRKLTSVCLKYGRTDGGQGGQWEKTVPLGKTTCGGFHVELVDLEEDTGYFYTFSASNSAGTVEAEPSGSFSTLKAVTPTVLVELDAGSLEKGELDEWANKGSLGGHLGSDGTTPLVEDMAAVRCVTFDGPDRMIASFRAPESITGLEGWSCEVWALNPEVNAGEETMVSWAARPGHCIQVSYGHSDRWGALGTYSDPATLGWTGGLPKAGEWHHLVVTYQGGEGGYMKAYADGELNARKRGSLNTGANEEVVLGNCREEGLAGNKAGWSLPFSGSLAFVRIYDGELTPSAVRERHRAGVPGGG